MRPTVPGDEKRNPETHGPETKTSSVAARQARNPGR